MVKISRQKMVLFRVSKLRKAIKIDTQRMRGKSLKALEEMFNMAKELAQNTNLELSLRLKWTRVGAYICQVISSVAAGFDEKQIDVQLDELERLVNEAKAKTKAKKPKKSIERRAENKASKGSC